MNASSTPKKHISLPAASRWHWILIGGGLLAIAAHFAIRWTGLSPVGSLSAAAFRWSLKSYGKCFAGIRC